MDDDPINRRVAAAMFGRLGCTRDLAESGERALEALSAKRYDVVFADVRMPGMSGLELASRIRARAGAPQPRIVALTASAFEEDRAACLAAGMDDFLSKPVQLATLGAALARAEAARDPVPSEAS